MISRFLVKSGPFLDPPDLYFHGFRVGGVAFSRKSRFGEFWTDFSEFFIRFSGLSPPFRTSKDPLGTSWALIPRGLFYSSFLALALLRIPGASQELFRVDLGPFVDPLNL